MTLQPSLFDVCAGKHGGVPESKAANLKAAPHKQVWHQRILHTLKIKGPSGATCREIATSWNVEMHQISGRITELLAAGKVRKSLTRRDGGRVILPL